MRYVGKKQEGATLGMLLPSALEGVCGNDCPKTRRPSLGVGLLRVGVVSTETEPGRLYLGANHCTCRAPGVTPAATGLPLEALPADSWSVQATSFSLVGETPEKG